MQRPDMLETIALDLYLLRVGAKVVSSLFPVKSDLVGVVDTWGFGFVDELDYRREAANTSDFMREIAKTPLRDAVFAPEVVDPCTSRKVMTTKWVDGERLEQSSAADVSKLCSVAMNTYLTMMLETGVLHADPHPGNLLRAQVPWAPLAPPSPFVLCRPLGSAAPCQQRRKRARMCGAPSLTHGGGGGVYAWTWNPQTANPGRLSND